MLVRSCGGSVASRSLVGGGEEVVHVYVSRKL